jgi:hypothetical protein
MIPDYIIQAALDSGYGQSPAPQAAAAWTATQAPVSLGGAPMQPVSLGTVGEAVNAATPYAQTVWTRLQDALNTPQQPVTLASPQAPQAAPAPAPVPPAAPQRAAPPPELPPEPAPEPAAPAGPSPMSSVLEQAIRGSQQVVPGGFRQTGYQVAQEGPVAMPGTDIERQGPTISTGVPDIDPATFRSLSPEQQREYLARLTTQETKPLRVGPEPVDMDLFDALTPEQQQEYQRRLDAQTSTVSTGPEGFRRVKVGKGKNARYITEPVNREFAPSGEPIRPQSPYGRASADLAMSQDVARLGEEQIFDDKATAAELQARAYSAQEEQARADVARIEDDQSKRAAFIANELPRLEKYLDDRAKIQAMNPVESYYERKGPRGRLMNAIAIGLSTLGSGLNGAPNIAWEMIQKEIDGEVLKQRQTTEALGQQYMARRQLYADMLGQFQTPEAAANASRYALQMAAVAELNKLGSRAHGDDMKNAAGMLSSYGKVEADKQKKAALEGTQRTLWQNVPSKVVGQQGGLVGLGKVLTVMGVPTKEWPQIYATYINKGPQAAAALIGANNGPGTEGEVRAAEFRIGRQVEIPASLGGGTGYAHIDSEANKVREGLSSIELMKKNNAELRSLVNKDFRKHPDAARRIAQIVTDNTFELKNQKELGVLSADDYEKADNLNGRFVGEFGLGDRLKALDGMNVTLQRGAEKLLSKLGKDPMLTAPFRSQVRERAVK